MTDKFSFPARLQFLNDFTGSWSGFLSEAELRLASFVVSHTLSRGKTSGHYREEHIRFGIPNRKEGGMLHRGTGLARSSVYKAIKGLNDKGLITSFQHDKDGFKGGWTFTLQLGRLPDEKFIQEYEAKRAAKKAKSKRQPAKKVA